MDRREPNKVDETVLFSALQSELNSRVSTRASINTTHIQTIVAFVGAYILLRNQGGFGDDEKNRWLPYLFSTVIPLISFYFISLYRHNDMQIGLLNRDLRKIEEASMIRTEFRFFQRDSYSFSHSNEARRISQFAIMCLCFASPFIVFIDWVFFWFFDSSRFDFTPKDAFALIVSAVVSVINVYSLRRLDQRRAEFNNS